MKIAEEQRREGVRVIKPPHALGFLDPDLPEKSRPLQPALEAAPAPQIHNSVAMLRRKTCIIKMGSIMSRNQLVVMKLASGA